MTIKKDSIKYLFELLVVFLGVTSAAEYSRDRKDKQRYLTDIYEEIQEDDTNLKKLIEYYRLKNRRNRQLTKFDRTDYNLFKYQEYIEEFMTQSLLNYALRYFDLNTFKAFDKQSITNPYFINAIKTYHQILQNYHDALKSAHQECLEVKKQLEDK